MIDRRTAFAALVPELSRWNAGAGIDPQDWIECVGTYELAAGYSLIFWPGFVRVEGYVLREGFSEVVLRCLERRVGAERESIEAVMNHVHLADLHCNVAPSEAQLRYLGCILKEIHETKLRRDFPGVDFVVRFNDEPGLALLDYELTFWQRPSVA